MSAGKATYTMVRPGIGVKRARDELVARHTYLTSKIVEHMKELRPLIEEAQEIEGMARTNPAGEDLTMLRHAAQDETGAPPLFSAQPPG
jgi:hypothetical protein